MKQNFEEKYKPEWSGSSWKYPEPEDKTRPIGARPVKSFPGTEWHVEVTTDKKGFTINKYFLYLEEVQKHCRSVQRIKEAFKKFKEENQKYHDITEDAEKLFLKELNLEEK